MDVTDSILQCVGSPKFRMWFYAKSCVALLVLQYLKPRDREPPKPWLLHITSTATTADTVSSTTEYHWRYQYHCHNNDGYVDDPLSQAS